MSVDPQCIFCKIIKGEIPSHKVYENDLVFAFLDINPLAERHTLVIPKYHSEKLHGLPENDSAECGRAINKIVKAMGIEDYNILQNNGSIAHQVVKHVHFHIIPKPSKEQGLGLVWPSGETNHEQFSKQAEELRNKL